MIYIKKKNRIPIGILKFHFNFLPSEGVFITPSIPKENRIDNKEFK